MSVSTQEDWDRHWSRGATTIADMMEKNLRSSVVFGTSLRLLERYGKGAKVLEAGCGSGVWAFLLEQVGFEIWGVDFSEAAIKGATEYAKYHNLSSRFFQGDVREMSFPDNYFDVVVSYGVIEHFPDSENAVKEFYRVLRPGGACLVTAPNPFTFHRLIGRHVLNITKSARLGYVGYEDNYTPRALAEMLKELGFQEVTCGILEQGLLFGMFWPSIPVVGKALYYLLQKASFFIERRQSLIGTGSYAIGYKY